MSAAVESIMDVSIGSDGERSSSSLCGSPPISPSESSPPLKLKFSIANILRPEFGKLEKESMKRPESANSLPGTPCTSLSPADLANPKTLASAMAMSRPPVLWPAWVYCTRYSDRPSSGERQERLPASVRGRAIASADGRFVDRLGARGIPPLHGPTPPLSEAGAPLLLLHER
uniref:Uncharacterized protein n=1 Tax=Plectus sambesii TaxID=2011161 RepID=A0A914X5G9_9BILA